MTNAERIRQMSDEELAKIIMCPYELDPDTCNNTDCIDCCHEWLNKESDTND